MSQACFCYAPIRQALDISYPKQPAESALLDLLPPPEQQATIGTSSRPSLASMLRHYEKKRQQGAVDAGQATGDSAGGGAANDGGAVGQQAGSVPQSAAADLANELQYTLQQAEEAALREKRAAEERETEEREQQQQGGQQERQHGGSGRSGDGAAGQTAGGVQDGSAYQELSQALLQQGIQRRPLAVGDGPIGLGAAANAGSGVRMLVGVASACCTDKAAERRAIIRDTWARTIREVRGLGGVGFEGPPGKERGMSSHRSHLASARLPFAALVSEVFVLSALPAIRRPTQASTFGSSWHSRRMLMLQRTGCLRFRYMRGACMHHAGVFRGMLPSAHTPFAAFR